MRRSLLSAVLVVLTACGGVPTVGSPCASSAPNTCGSESSLLQCSGGRWESVTCGTGLNANGCNDWSAQDGGVTGASCAFGDLPEGAPCAFMPMHIGIGQCSSDRSVMAKCVDGVVHRSACPGCPGTCD